MAELVPSVLFYSQAATMLRHMREEEDFINAKDLPELVELLSSLLTAYRNGVGKPFLKYEPVVEYEPPSSKKSLRLWSSLEDDVNLIQQQLEILIASTVQTHSLISTGIMHERNENARVEGKLKTLQMYSNSTGDNVVRFSDSFVGNDFIDITKSADDLVSLLGGYVTLGVHGEVDDVSQDAEITILPASNGFIGNNREIEDPNSAPIDPETQQPMYEFKAETDARNDLEDIIDGEPDTWIEYERYALTDDQKESSPSRNFYYLAELEDGTFERVDWATAPPNGTLRLALEFDFKGVRNINSVEFIPYAMEENKNHPLLVRSIQTSADGTDWKPVEPRNLWITPEINLATARMAENAVSNVGRWHFRSRKARFVRVAIDQQNSMPSQVGNLHWVDRRNDEFVEGPIPPINDPNKYLSRMVVGDAMQRREYHDGRRWAIGIRDINITHSRYRTTSTMVTRPLRVEGIIDRVLLERVEMEIPAEYPSDEAWVKFFVTPNDGQDWYEISPIQDDYRAVPEIISFNDPLHASLRERGVKNYDVDSTVNTLRLKVELSRPGEFETTTPILHSYTLKVLKR